MERNLETPGLKFLLSYAENQQKSYTYFTTIFSIKQVHSSKEVPSGPRDRHLIVVTVASTYRILRDG